MQLTKLFAATCLSLAVASSGAVFGTAVSADQPDSANASPATDIELARQTLGSWQKLVSEHPEWFEQSNGLVAAYREAWGALDLDEAIRIDLHPHRHGNRTNLLYRLVYAAEKEKRPSDQVVKKILSRRPNISFDLEQKEHSDIVEPDVQRPSRFADIERVALRNEPDRIWYLTRFWPRVAEYGASMGDAEMVEFAKNKFESLASRAPANPNSPSVETLEIRAGRFFVAASQLELLRNQSDGNNNPEKIRQAANELWLAANAFSPFDSPVTIFSKPYETCPDYAALETWAIRDTPNDWVVKQIDQARLNMPESLKPLFEIVDNKFYWAPVKLPELSAKAVTPWIHHQIQMGRTEVVIAYLAQAKGDPFDRARLLSILAQGLAKSDVGDAKICLDVAESLIASQANRRMKSRSETPTQWRADIAWSRIEAQAELALAYLAAGKDKLALSYTQDAISNFQAIISPDGDKTFEQPLTRKQLSEVLTSKLNYDAFQTLILAASKTGLTSDEVPKPLALAAKQMGFHARIAEKYPLLIRNVMRVADISKIVSTPEKFVYDEHRKFNQLVLERKWSVAAAEVERLADGNSAWKREFADIGAKSFHDQGLEKTLQWTATIRNDSMRMAIELGAIGAAIKPELEKTIPRSRDVSSPKSIATGIRWPSSGC